MPEPERKTIPLADVADQQIVANVLQVAQEMEQYRQRLIQQVTGFKARLENERDKADARGLDLTEIDQLIAWVDARIAEANAVPPLEV